MQSINNRKWLLVDSKKVFSSKWMSIEKRAYKLPNGEVIEDYYHLDRPDYVLIVATDDKNRLLLEYQYRRGVDKFTYELPAGWIEKGETPTQAAKRELKEETGAIGVGDIAIELFTQPGFSSMRSFACSLRVHRITDKNLGDDEFIVTKWVSREDTIKMINEGQIKDMGSLAALSLFSAKI